jgi:hypothetical protein
MTLTRTMASLPFVTFLLSVVTPSLVSSAALGKRSHDSPNQRSIVVKNQSGRRLDLLWINTIEPPGPDGKFKLQSNSENGEGYAYGSDQGISSYIGHEFRVQEMPAKSTGKCLENKKCRTGYFKVNEEEDQGEKSN